MKREPIYIGVISAAVVIIAAVMTWYAWPETTEELAPPEVLVRQIESAPTTAQKVKAAQDFARHGEVARTQVRTAITNHKRYEPEVVAPLLQATMKNRDYRSMPVLIELLEHEDPHVRGRAGAAIQKILGADFGFRANLPESERKKIVAMIKHDYEISKSRFSTVYGEQN